jgi:methylenetetrahydrofolate dehydrogenase (NADP+)/methenyltetrahydrofolate cyclohydrolase
MTAVLIDGRAQAAHWRAETASGVAAFVQKHGRAPNLQTILIGDDPASAIYVQGKLKAAREVGIDAAVHTLPADVSQDVCAGLILRLNADPLVDGILLQLPVPLQAARLSRLIDPAKDVDGLTPLNAGLMLEGAPEALLPCTPMGCLRLIRSVRAELTGLNAVVLGRSRLVGRPMADLLLRADSTVTIAHSRTQNLPDLVRTADIVVAAVGHPSMVQGSWIKPKAIVIDVGISRMGDGKLCGDVDFSTACEVASAITPVPGGVGPMTIAGLLHNTLKAALLRAGDKTLAFGLKIA